MISDIDLRCGYMRRQAGAGTVAAGIGMVIIMDEKTLDRETAWKILNTHVKEESLLRHCIMVEAVMRHFAGLYHESAEEWGVIGLLHDVDFEEFPEQHCAKTRSILEPLGVSQEIIRAIESHGYKLVNDIQPRTDAEKVLYAVDELTGLVAATAILRPGKSIFGLPVKSVKKKWKQKSFAVNVSREVIADGAEMLGQPVDFVIEQTIEGMKSVADEIGLRGDPSVETAENGD
jgi:predicted hydrolase (HD superfamily)